MKVSKKDLKKGKYKLTITVEPEDLLNYNKSIYEKDAKDVKISGFRPGKAPRKLIEEAIGITKLLSESIDVAVQQEYYMAIQQEKMIPVGAPKVTISKYPNWGLELSEISSDLVFEAEVEVMPEVVLKDYSKVKIKKKETSEITKDDVEKILLHLRRQKANFLEIDRPAKTGDRAEISYQGSINKVKKDSMAAKNQPIILGENTLIPGFEQEIIGLKKAEKKNFKITFPKDYHAKDFAGKKAEFEVELVDLKEVSLPDLNDEFAKNFGHQNISSLKVAIEKSLKDEVAEKARQEIEAEVIEKVLPYLSVEVPEGLIDQEVDRMIANMSQQIENRGMKMDKYLESIKKTLSEIRKEMRNGAEKNIKIGFLLGKVIEEEKIDSKNPDAGKIALEKIISKVSN